MILQEKSYSQNQVNPPIPPSILFSSTRPHSLSTPEIQSHQVILDSGKVSQKHGYDDQQDRDGSVSQGLAVLFQG
jgi:hypothetical protein